MKKIHRHGHRLRVSNKHLYKLKTIQNDKF